MRDGALSRPKRGSILTLDRSSSSRSDYQTVAAEEVGTGTGSFYCSPLRGEFRPELVQLDLWGGKVRRVRTRIQC